MGMWLNNPGHSSALLLRRDLAPGLGELAQSLLSLGDDGRLDGMGSSWDLQVLRELLKEACRQLELLLQELHALVMHALQARTATLLFQRQDDGAAQYDPLQEPCPEVGRMCRDLSTQILLWERIEDRILHLLGQAANEATVSTTPETS